MYLFIIYLFTLVCSQTLTVRALVLNFWNIEAVFIWSASRRVVRVSLIVIVFVCGCRSEVRSSGQHGVRQREQRGGEEYEGMWVICAEAQRPAAAEGLYRAALLLTARQTHGLPQRILRTAGKGLCLFLHNSDKINRSGASDHHFDFQQLVMCLLKQ